MHAPAPCSRFKRLPTIRGLLAMTPRSCLNSEGPQRRELYCMEFHVHGTGPWIPLRRRTSGAWALKLRPVSSRPPRGFARQFGVLGATKQPDELCTEGPGVFTLTSVCLVQGHQVRIRGRIYRKAFLFLLPPPDVPSFVLMMKLTCGTSLWP